MNKLKYWVNEWWSNSFSIIFIYIYTPQLWIPITINFSLPYFTAWWISFISYKNCIITKVESCFISLGWLFSFCTIFLLSIALFAIDWFGKHETRIRGHWFLYFLLSSTNQLLNKINLFGGTRKTVTGSKWEKQAVFAG